MDAINWKALKSIQKLASESGGYVFGGFPRDSIIHEKGAVSFYDSRGKNKWDYNNPEHHPESYIARTTIPKDIDVYMQSCNIPKFYAALNRNMFSVKKVGSEVEKYKLGVKHLRIQVSLVCNPAITKDFLRDLPVIQVDILHTDNPRPDFFFNTKVIDFACNSLYIAPDGSLQFAGWNDYFFPMNLTHLQEIMVQIQNRKAVVLSSPALYRARHMLDKGYEIVWGKSQLTKTPSTCIICHDEMGMTSKNSCCSATFHPACYLRYMHSSTQKKCVQCRTDEYHHVMVEIFQKFDSLMLCQ